MTAYVQTNSQTRAVVFVAIVLIHFFFGWALVTGLAQKAGMKIVEALVTDIVEEEIKEDKPPPPPPPEMERPPVEVPPPEVTIDMPVEATETTALSNVTDKPQPPPPPPQPTSRPTPPKIKSMPATEDYYPPSSIRNEEQGSSTIEACVDAKGKLTKEPVVRGSSGFPKLDEAAVKMTRAGRFQPGTFEGQPMAESCFAFKVKFQLKN